MSNKYFLNGHEDDGTLLPYHGCFLATFSDFEAAKRDGVRRLMENEYECVTIEDNNHILWTMKKSDLIS